MKIFTYESIVVDGQAALEYTLNKFHKVEVMGSSLGGGVATASLDRYLTKTPLDTNRITQLVNHDSFTNTPRVIFPNNPLIADFLGDVVGANLDAMTPMKNLINRGVKVSVFYHTKDPIIPVGARMGDFIQTLPKKGNVTVFASHQYSHANLSSDMVDCLGKESIFSVPKSNFYTPSYGTKWTNPERAKIYKDTIQAMDYGYQLDGKSILLNSDNVDTMMLGTRFYESIEELEPIKKPLKTIFSVDTDDTFNVLLKLKNEGKNPVGINMAHSTHRGGGVLEGCPAQEECQYRRSDYRKTDSIKTIREAVLKEGVIYTPSITVFRKDESEGFAFMERPQTVAVVAVAGFDFREGSLDRLELGLPLYGLISEDLLRRSSAYINGTKNRIRNMLRAMARNGHTDIVLGALGCGAFENPPKFVADLFGEVFSETEFKGRFESVHFAVLLKSYDKDRLNVDAFQNFCAKMNR